jgi:hypothetical protein
MVRGIVVASVLMLSSCSQVASLTPTAEPTAGASTAAPSEATTEPTASPTSAAPLNFTGSGTQTTDVFELEAGDYLLAWSAHAPDGNGCPYSISLEPIGHDELIAPIFDIAAGSDTSTGSTTDRLDGGRYAFNVSSSCDWTITVEPR